MYTSEQQQVYSAEYQNKIHTNQKNPLFHKQEANNTMKYVRLKFIDLIRWSQR